MSVRAHTINTLGPSVRPIRLDQIGSTYQSNNKETGQIGLTYQTSTDRHRQAQTDTHRHRQAQTEIHVMDGSGPIHGLTASWQTDEQKSRSGPGVSRGGRADGQADTCTDGIEEHEFKNIAIRSGPIRSNMWTDGRMAYTL